MKKIHWLLFSLSFFFNAQVSKAADNAVLLVYHHVSNKTPASTSISPEKFREHMDYLSRHHTVLPLPELITALQNNEPLPENAVAITFDDGFHNILTNGHPILKEYGFSYTIFINPGLIGKLKNQLTWAQIEVMQKQGVTFANHGFEHTHYLYKNKNESTQAWLSRVIGSIEKAESQLKNKIGSSHKFIAYPYGEFNQVLKQKLVEAGYVGFAQHSGAISGKSDFGALPRFAAAGIYANLNTLKTKLGSLAMPVLAKSELDPELAFDNTGALQTITLNTQDLRMSQVNCFKNGKAMTVQTEKSNLTLLIDAKLPPGRTRINCTAPSIQQRGRYYWYSQPWFVPTEEGKWLE